MALKGITILCQEGVIDIMTTVKVLAPKFKLDPRPGIARQFYQLLSVAPGFHIENEDFTEFLKANLTMMWKYSFDNSLNIETRSFILQSMSQFPLELHKLEMMPDIALEVVPKNDEGQISYEIIPGKILTNLSMKILEFFFGFVLNFLGMFLKLFEIFWNFLDLFWNFFVIFCNFLKFSAIFWIF